MIIILVLAIIITIILSILFVHIVTIADYNETVSSIVLFFCLIGTIFIMGITLNEIVKADEQDVINGNAEYREILHVIGNDTIKTYEIVYKNQYK